MTGYVAHAEIEISAPPSRVWQALTDPSEVRAYFFGTELVTDWKPGSPIHWRGEWNGQPYQDKGTVLDFDPPRRLRTTHFSPLTGQPDRPENYHSVSYELTETGSGTRVEISQDNNADADAAARSSQNWQSVLAGLKQHVEVRR